MVQHMLMRRHILLGLALFVLCSGAAYLGVGRTVSKAQADPVHVVFLPNVVSNPDTPAGGTIPAKPTRLPTPTPTPVAGIQPYVGAPRCESHNPITYHALWDYERGCHYNHTHNADPREGDQLFGPAGARWGQTIAYPWETHHENSTKHEGFKYAVTLNKECTQGGYLYIPEEERNCVRSFRLQYHSIGGAPHAAVRLHSYYLEAEVCTRNFVHCGIVKTGGWADFVVLVVPYKAEIVPLPSDPEPRPDESPGRGYRGHNTIEMAEVSTLYNMGKDGDERIKDNRYTWSSDNTYGYNQIGRYFFRALDDWGGVDRANPEELHLLCPDFRCRFNHSEHHVFNVNVDVPAALDLNGDGFVNYSGYTDNKGNVVMGCTAPGPDCVPLEIFDAPVGFAVWTSPHTGPRPVGQGGEWVREFDLSPGDEWWIEYPN